MYGMKIALYNNKRKYKAAGVLYMKIYKDAFNFKDRVALVTGAGGGIGREIAKGFASCGANVIVASRNMSNLNDTIKELSVYEGEHTAISVDVTNIDSINAMIYEINSKYGKIDFLSNHAGMNIRKPAIDFIESDWEKICNTNLKGSFFVAQAVGREMIKNSYGKIVNTASVSAKRGHKNLAIYAATKGGMIQYTKVLAHEWASFGINVNAIAPGYVMTNQTENLLADDIKYNKMILQIPMGRFGTMLDMVGTVLFLCSDISGYITGQTIYIDGGRTID